MVERVQGGMGPSEWRLACSNHLSVVLLENDSGGMLVGGPADSPIQLAFDKAVLPTFEQAVISRNKNIYIVEGFSFNPPLQSDIFPAP